MAKIFLVINDEKKSEIFKSFFEKEHYQYVISKESLSENSSKIAEFFPDVILIDSEIENASNLVKLIKSSINRENIQLIILLPHQKELAEQMDFLEFADGFAEGYEPNNILKNTIESHLKTKKSLDMLSENNKDLSKNLYQLNALYKTSSQFAGTLNKEKLCRIMLEGLEQILSFDIASALVFDIENKANLYINSVGEISQILQDALQLRILLNYKNLFTESELPFDILFDDINIIKDEKPSRHIYDLKALNYDSLFMPIQVGENFFGVVEILREIPFTREDILSFQTIAHQVALPLRSATLYEEIKRTNVKLEKLERMKSEFVSIVSHELRTPLTPINNSLEIVLSEQAGKITPDIKNFIEMAKRNVLRLSGIIEDLLDLSRIQTGKFEFKFKKTTVTPCLELLKQTFERSAQEKAMDFKVNINPELPELYIDPHRIEQVLSNLVSNALKFTSNNGKIYVTTEVVDIKNENTNFVSPKPIIAEKYLKISVNDNGIGIKDEDIETIFDKFSQIESSLTRNRGGVGLGLSITKQLIDSHFALVGVKSKKDEGSRFSIYLPLYNKKNAFRVDLNDAIAKNQDLGLVFVRSKENCGFIEYLKESNILKRTQNSKEITLKNNDNIYYWLFIPQAQHLILDFIEKAIQSELQKEKSKWEKCDIVFKRADKKNIDSLNKLIEEMQKTRGEEIE